MTTLRRRPPYTCRRPLPLVDNRGQGLCLAVLAEADGSMCPPCAEAVRAAAEAAQEARARFDGPIRVAARRDWLDGARFERIWP